jgi:ariadne-2
MMSEAECESDMDCSGSDSGDAGYEDYYSTQPWDGEIDNDIGDNQQVRDPEYAVYECLRVDEVERLLNENVEFLTTNLQITPSLAKLFLHTHEWALQDILLKYQDNASNIMVDSKIRLSHLVEPLFTIKYQKGNLCSVCFINFPAERFNNLNCGHSFCNDCWCTYFEIQISQGVSTGIDL